MARPNRRLVGLLVIALVPSYAACDHEEADRISDGGSGGDVTTTVTGGGGGMGGGGGSLLPGLAIDALAAPDEHSVQIRFSVEPDAPSAASPEIYRISSAAGAIEVTGASYDPETLTVTLSTAKQKLGVTYTLVVDATGESLDGFGGEFLAADTASFWASDFDDPNFADYVVVAERVAVGEHSVAYVEKGVSSVGAEAAVHEFDDKIYPIETDLFIAAPDMDDNDRIVLLGLDGGNHYGGYFTPLNAMADEETMATWQRHSNEMEMLYVNVVGLGGFDTEVVVPHEFQHLLYHERHGLGPNGDWDYHNEGLAECAVAAVHGQHAWALAHYVADPSGLIAKGLSLINWKWGSYDQYTLAYVFWSYVASRLGGVSGFGKIFDTDGHPQHVDAFLKDELGSDLSTTQLDALIATWVQAPDGPHGFGGLLHLSGPPPTVASGVMSVDLEPFAGTFFKLAVPSVDYPGTQSPHVRYAGIDAAGNVDLQAPFEVSGGALVVLNTSFELLDFTPVHAGPDLPAVVPLPAVPATEPGPAAVPLAVRDRAWLHPPPVHPGRLARLRSWQRATRVVRSDGPIDR